MANETHTIIEVLEFVKTNGLSPFAEVVGRWVWLTFHEKPMPETRQLLKDFGFRWIQKRGRWAHNCGHYSMGSVRDPRHTYGAIRVDEIQTECLVGAV